MNDEWDDDFMPESGDYGITPGEAAHDVAVFLLKVLGVLLAAAAVAAPIAYGVWREFQIVRFLTS